MWNKEKINSYIENAIEENSSLEYKGGLSLDLSIDKNKSELCKDVSAFANSNGGILIYGISEFDLREKAHLPERITPVDGGIFTKERIEQILHSNIKPKIKDIEIIPVRINETTSESVYILDIPRSYTAHQSFDKKYYRRYNFHSVPMEDYEIRDTMNRNVSAKIKQPLKEDSIKFDRIKKEITLPIELMNSSETIAREIFSIITLRLKNISQTRNPENFIRLPKGEDLDISYQAFNDNIKIYPNIILKCGELLFENVEQPAQICFKHSIMGSNIEKTFFHFHLDIDNDEIVFTDFTN
jgi:Putative DNA-binding domain